MNRPLDVVIVVSSDDNVRNMVTILQFLICSTNTN